MKKLKFLLFIPIFLLIFSCKKDKWNKKASVSLNTVQSNVEFKNEGKNLKVKSYLLFLDHIEITGSRLQSEDVNIHLDDTITIDLINGTITNELNFELPQGNYSELKIQLGNSSRTNNIFIDLDFKQEEGVVKNKAGYSDINNFEAFNIKNSNQQETNTFLVKENENWSLQISLDQQQTKFLINSHNWSDQGHDNAPAIPQDLLSEVTETLFTSFKKTLKIKMEKK